MIKELTAIIQNPKFITTFATASLLLIISVFIGINEFKHSIKQYNTGTALTKSTTEDARSWHSVSSLAYRKPDPMQIFTTGINNDIGRFSSVNRENEVNLKNSSYSDDPIFAVFRFFDFAFIFTIVLSLFAIMFTYNSVNGEKEEGTLRLVFSNSVSRAEYIASKIVGSWLGLVVPLLIPISICYLLIMLFNVEFNYSDWSRLLTFTGTSLIYFSFFIVFGILVSSITKRSATSFLFLLTFWITTVFIVPRIGVIAAGQIIPIPSQAEIESQLDAYSKDTWNLQMKEVSTRWSNRNKQMEGMTPAERTAYEDEKSWGWMQEDDALRKEKEVEIAEYAKKLYEGYRNNKIELRKLALRFSRISPASAYQLASMNLATTDIELKSRYEEAIQNYREKFLKHADEKEAKEGGSFGMRITMDSETGFSVTDGRKENKLDFSELPKFVEPKYTYAEVLAPTLIDITILVILSIFSFGLSVFRFTRYDLR